MVYHIAKGLASILLTLLPRIISDQQSGFVAGRKILDGVAAIHEMVHTSRRSKVGAMYFKADMEKAFAGSGHIPSNISSELFHTFLLHRTGSPQCTNTVSFSILVNRRAAGTYEKSNSWRPALSFFINYSC